MKHINRLNLVLGLLFVFVLLLILVPAYARDIPFPKIKTVDESFAGAADITAADIDGDGDLDVVGAAKSDNDIAWWENTAGDAGNWSKHTVDGYFEGAAGVAAADVDSDGDLDILGAAIYADEIAWWENSAGDGSVWVKHSVDQNFEGAVDVTAADTDVDGDLDILGAAKGSNEIAMWENTAGDGSAWSKQSVVENFINVNSVAADDIDGDGNPEILGAASGSGEISWFDDEFGIGSWIQHFVASDFWGANSATAADVDGDGDLDVVGASNSANDVIWWENTAGNGSTWSKHYVDESFTGVARVVAADLDSDGDMDVLGAAHTYDVSWWENTSGDGSAWKKRGIDTNYDGVQSVAAGDVDGDGDQDVLGAAMGLPNVAWWENETIHRSAVFAADGVTIANDSFGLVDDIVPADLDGDGDLDVIGAAMWISNISWWENTGDDGGTWSRRTVQSDNAGWISVDAADLDGDNDLDILGAAETGWQFAWWENEAGDGTVLSKHDISGQDFQGASCIKAADLDSDGDMDVLGVAYFEKDVTWWENTAGDGSVWGEHTINTAFEEGAASVEAADVDGDGDLDIVVGHDDAVTWLENMTGDGSDWSKQSIGTSFGYARSVASADVDGDGDLDVLGAAWEDWDITWWENTTGDGSAWIEHTVDPNFQGAMRVAAADMDGDGDRDILAAAHDTSGNGVSWWENIAGNGSAWDKKGVNQTFVGATDAQAVDINSDGMADVLSSSSLATTTIIWWPNRGGQFALPTEDTAPAELLSGEIDDLLKIMMIHRGHSDDGDEELSSLALLFEEGEGLPLSSAAANAVIGKLSIYLDDGSDAFEIGNDTLVVSLDDLSLTDGVQTVTFVDGDANVQVEFGSPRTYFVVVEIAAGAAGQTAIDQFQVTHLTESSSTADDRAYDIPLVLEYSANVTSKSVMVRRTHVWDGGGVTNNWSEAANWQGDTLPRDTVDYVRFDETSGKDAVVDVGYTQTVAGVTISPGYTGTISQQNDLAISTNWNQDGGEFSVGAKVLDIGGAFRLSGGIFKAAGQVLVGGDFHYTGGNFENSGGTIVFDGSAPQTMDAGDITFNNLTVNSGSMLVTKRDISMDGTLTNNGTLQQTKNPWVEWPTWFYVGDYGGVWMTYNNGALGDTTVTIRGNQDCTSVAGEGVRRCFDIAPTNTSGLDAGLAFYFSKNELGGEDCDTLNVYSWTGNTWEELELDTSYEGGGRWCRDEPYSVAVKNVTEFSSFVLKSGPIETQFNRQYLPLVMSQ